MDQTRMARGKLLSLAAAVTIGLLMVGCSPEETEPSDGSEEQAGGEQDGEDNESESDGNKESGPPEEAVDEVEEGPDSATAEPGSAHGDVGLFTTRAIDGLAGVEVFVFDAQGVDGGVRFTVNGQSDGVRMQAPEFTQDAFYVVADGQRLQPDQEFSYTPAPDEPQGEESNEFTLSIPDAPASGLLAFKGPATEDGELPAVGLCYDTEENIFSTQYDQCT